MPNIVPFLVICFGIPAKRRVKKHTLSKLGTRMMRRYLKKLCQQENRKLKYFNKFSETTSSTVELRMREPIAQRITHGQIAKFLEWSLNLFWTKKLALSPRAFSSSSLSRLISAWRAVMLPVASSFTTAYNMKHHKGLNSCLNHSDSK